MKYPLLLSLLFSLSLLAQETEHREHTEHLELAATHTTHTKSNPVTDSIEDWNTPLAAECDPTTTVANCVNVLSGHFFQADCDFIGNTIDPLQLTRYYDSGNPIETFLGIGFGSQFPLIATESQKGARYSHALISERDGFLVPYKGDSKYSLYFLDPKLLEKGFTNLSCRTPFVNWKALHQETPKGSRWVVSLGNGTKRIYGKYFEYSEKSKRQAGIPTKKVCLLTEERKPNGNRVEYQYKTFQDKPYLTRVKTVNRENYLINEIHLSHSSEGCTLTSSCGQKIHYTLETEECQDHTTQKRILTKTQGFFGKSQYKTKHAGRDLPIIVKVEGPKGDLKIKYNKDNQVEQIIEPFEGTEITTHRFKYEKDYTLVADALNNITRYTFEAHRLSTIDTLDQGKVIRQKAFRWNPKGWLRSKSIRVGEHIYYLIDYDYDTHGNITSETLIGNLTGEKPKTFKNRSETDHYTLHYEYTDNFLTKQITEGVEITYDYLPNTNLCTRELHTYNGKIQKRYFFTYDPNGEIQHTIEDDGSGQDPSDLTDVLLRKEKTITAESHTGASFGKPKIIQETYLQNGTLIPLTRTKIRYDENGKEIFRRVNQDVTTKSYDEKQRLIQETNPLGHTTYYTYDQNNNKIKEEYEGKVTHYTYDLSNQLIQKSEEHTTGTYITQYKYNPLHQLITEIDPYGHETHYTYDRLGRQTTQTKRPMEDGLGGLARPIITKTYGTLNHLKSETDENCNITRYTRNIRGEPTQIHYPDGGIEKFTYYVSGKLKQKWHCDNTSISYTYDPKGHVLTKTHHDAQGNPLKKEEYTYKGDLLLSKNSNGLLTQYTYDGAGRKIAEHTHDHYIEYQWDAMNRLTQKKQHSQIETFQYDALSRLITLEKRDPTGKLYYKEQYEYDPHGNQTKKILWQNETQKSETISHYATDGTLQWTSDPLEHRTTWYYNHHHHNGQNQRIQARSQTDPLGRVTLEADDTFHRLVRRDTYEGEQQNSRTHYEYDGKGQLVKEYTHVLKEGQNLREYGYVRSHNFRGQIISETEIHGLTTLYHYDTMGRLIEKRKPDGGQLFYTYDPLGRRISQRASDGSLHYHYTYDIHDNLITIEDLVHHTIQKREYDENNRLIKEEFAPDIIFTYQYDPLDRVIQMTLPDQSPVHYHYDAYHLRSIQRKEYQLEFSYDLQGHLISQQNPIGMTHTTYDLLGRKIKIQKDNWESTQTFDPVGNLIEIQDQKIQTFTYDRLNHLTSEPDNHYTYDSLGNCHHKNDQSVEVNNLNQIVQDGNSAYTYDFNGNLIAQSHPPVHYQYDALNRLTHLNEKRYQYDAFNRCLFCNGKQLLYQKEHEIGSFAHGQLQEFRLIHPQMPQLTLAIELQNQVYFPVQDARYNIRFLQNTQGEVTHTYDYSAFGLDTQEEACTNPWKFANRREESGLTLFTHRWYNPTLRRWQTPDPLGFADGLNKYAYVHNNPFVYTDPDGRIAFALPVFTFAFGAECFLTAVTAAAFWEVAVAAVVCYGVYEGTMWCFDKVNNEEGENGKEDEKDKEKPRTEPQNLEEQLTLAEAQGGSGKRIMEDKINDPRYLKNEWEKRQHIHYHPDGAETNVHYWEHIPTKDRHGFKFKDD